MMRSSWDASPAVRLVDLMGFEIASADALEVRLEEIEMGGARQTAYVVLAYPCFSSFSRDTNLWSG